MKKVVILAMMLCASLPAFGQNTNPQANDRRATLDRLLGSLKSASSVLLLVYAAGALGFFLRSTSEGDVSVDAPSAWNDSISFFSP